MYSIYIYEPLLSQLCLLILNIWGTLVDLCVSVRWHRGSRAEKACVRLYIDRSSSITAAVAHEHWLPAMKRARSQGLERIGMLKEWGRSAWWRVRAHLCSIIVCCWLPCAARHKKRSIVHRYTRLSYTSNGLVKICHCIKKYYYASHSPATSRVIYR